MKHVAVTVVVALASEFVMRSSRVAEPGVWVGRGHTHTHIRTHKHIEINVAFSFLFVRVSPDSHFEFKISYLRNQAYVKKRNVLVCDSALRLLIQLSKILNVFMQPFWVKSLFETSMFPHGNSRRAWQHGD